MSASTIDSSDHPLDRLARRAVAANHERSDWSRYTIPFEAIDFLTEEQAAIPRRSLEQIAMPPVARAQIESLESIVRQFGRLPERVTAFTGMSAPLASVAGQLAADGFGLEWSRGQLLELRGFVSASATIEPVLFAAGMTGAILEIDLHTAANLAMLIPRQGESEFILPRDCRCQVTGTIPLKTFRTQDGDDWVRTVVQLQQL